MTEFQGWQPGSTGGLFRLRLSTLLPQMFKPSYSCGWPWSQPKSKQTHTPVCFSRRKQDPWREPGVLKTASLHFSRGKVWGGAGGHSAPENKEVSLSEAPLLLVSSWKCSFLLKLTTTKQAPAPDRRRKGPTDSLSCSGKSQKAAISTCWAQRGPSADPLGTFATKH